MGRLLDRYWITRSDLTREKSRSWVTSAAALTASALAACTAITVTMYARRKGWPLDDIDVCIEHGKLDQAYVLTRRITYVGNLSVEQREMLTAVANKCPVHKTLSGEIRIVTEDVSS